MYVAHLRATWRPRKQPVRVKWRVKYFLFQEVWWFNNPCQVKTITITI